VAVQHQVDLPVSGRLSRRSVGERCDRCEGLAGTAAKAGCRRCPGPRACDPPAGAPPAPEGADLRRSRPRWRTPFLWPRH